MFWGVTKIDRWYWWVVFEDYEPLCDGNPSAQGRHLGSRGGIRRGVALDAAVNG
jgi:hypothetical protein